MFVPMTVEGGPVRDSKAKQGWYLFRLTGLAAIYFALGLLSFWFAAQGGGLAESVVLHEGFGVAVGVLFGAGIWPSILLGHLALAWHQGFALPTAMAVAVANVIVLLVSLQFLRVLRFDAAMSTLRDYLALVLVATLIAQPLSGNLGLLIIASQIDTGVAFSDLLPLLLRTWLDKAALEILVVATLLTTVAVWRRPRPIRTLATLSALLLLILLALSALLLSPLAGMLHPLHILSLVYLAVVGVAGMFDLLGASAASMVVLVTLQVATKLSQGPLYQLLTTEERHGGLNIYLLGMILGAGVMGALLRQRTVYESQLEQQASRDPLTGLYNRRYFFEAAERELNRARRAASRAGLIWIDIDRFKAINDDYGHAVGDRALVFLADILNSEFRAEDLVARLGGEEFVILTGESGDLLALANRLRQQLWARLVAQAEIPPFTLSIGVTYLEPGDTNVEAALSRADAALYEAKGQGRDAVVMR